MLTNSMADWEPEQILPPLVGQSSLLLTCAVHAHMVTSMIEVVIEMQEVLASAPLVGDLEAIKANEEFIASSKVEKHAARMHAEAARLYSEDG